MAELGDIQYTNVNQGTRQVDRSLEAQGIASGLSVAETTIKAGATGAAINEMQDALAEGIQQATQEPTVETLDPTEVQIAGLSADQRAEVADLTNKIRTAQAKLRQGDGSAQRIIATHSLREAQRKLKQKYGFVGAQIDQAANTILSSSPEMLEMQAEAARRNAQNAQSQDFIDRMAKEGYTELKIPAKFDIGSPEFAYEYQKRSQWRQDQANAEMRYAALAASDKLNSVEKLKTFKEVALSEWSKINEDLMDPLREDLAQIDLARANGASDGQMAQMWKDFAPQANVYLRKMADFEMGIERGFSQVWGGEDQNSREYQGALAVKESLVSDIEFMRTMVAQGQVEIVDYIKGQQAARAAGALDQVPNLRMFAAIESLAPGLFDTIRQYDVTNTSTGQFDMLARGLAREITTAGLFALDKVVTGDGRTGAERDQRRKDFDAVSQTSGTYSKSNVPRENLNEVWSLIETPMLAFNDQMTTTPTFYDSEGKLSFYIDGLANNIGRFYDWSVRDRTAARNPNNKGYEISDITEQVDKIVDHLASDELYLRYKELDPTDPGRDHLAHQLQEYFLKQDLGGTQGGLKAKEGWFNEIREESTSQVFGLPLVQYIEMDVQKFHDEDRVVFNLNTDLLRKKAEEFDRATMGASYANMNRQSYYENLARTLQARVNQFADNMTKYGRLVAMTSTQGTHFMDPFYMQQDGTNLVELVFPVHFPHTEIK